MFGVSEVTIHISWFKDDEIETVIWDPLGIKVFNTELGVSPKFLKPISMSPSGDPTAVVRPGRVIKSDALTPVLQNDADFLGCVMASTSVSSSTRSTSMRVAADDVRSLAASSAGDYLSARRAEKYLLVTISGARARSG